MQQVFAGLNSMPRHAMLPMMMYDHFDAVLIQTKIVAYDLLFDEERAYKAQRSASLMRMTIAAF